MENLQPEKSRGKGWKNRIYTVVGMVLLIGGIVAVISVFVVPAVNRRSNDEAIEDIRSGKYAEDSVGSATQEAATLEAVSADGVSEQAAKAPLTPQDAEREQKLSGILADNTRIGIVEIDKIDVLYAIVEGTEDEQINRAIGHLTTSAGIGQPGNCVIAGHRGGYYGTFFERLPQLEAGDVVVLTDLNAQEYYYCVYDQKVVDPADWSVTEDLYDENQNLMSTLTLITCEDDTRKRIVVSAIQFVP